MNLRKIFFPQTVLMLERIEKSNLKLMKTFRGMNKLNDKINWLELKIRDGETARNQLAARITKLERKQRKS